MNIVDEDQRKAVQSYDPQAPVTRKGVLRSLTTGKPIEIRDEDVVGFHLIYNQLFILLIFFHLHSLDVQDLLLSSRNLIELAKERMALSVSNQNQKKKTLK